MKDSTLYRPETYKELIRKGYKPIKKYKRFLLLRKGTMNRCILWTDIKEAIGDINE